jgi:threonine aldolase
MFGGGMRQAGIIAAGALYAIEHNIERLAQDHANAKRLATALAAMPGVSIDLDAVETNIVFFDVSETKGPAKTLCDTLHEQGVWVLPEDPQRVRAVTHLDVSSDDIDRAIAVLQTVLT